MGNYMHENEIGEGKTVNSVVANSKMHVVDGWENEWRRKKSVRKKVGRIGVWELQSEHQTNE